MIIHFRLPNESVDSYITALMKLSEACGFGTLRESLVRDRLVLGLKNDKVREEFLGKRDLDSDKAIEMSKSSQVTHSRASEIVGELFTQKDVNAVKQNSKAQGKGKPR